MALNSILKFFKVKAKDDENTPGIIKKKEKKTKESKAVQIVRQFFEYYNAQDKKNLIRMMTSDCVIHFANAEVSGDAFIEKTDFITKSFPDQKLNYEKIIDVSPGVVQLINARVSGTHTGEPFGFGPYPPIEAKGCKVINDPENMTVYVDEAAGVLKMVVVKSTGRRTGPVGFYEQIGGTLF